VSSARTTAPAGSATSFDHSTTVREEPEGLTFWDLDADGRAPGLRGQLHVVLLDNDLVTADDVYVKHYRLSLEDSTPPVLTCPADRPGQCSVHTGVPLADPQLLSFFSAATAVDACDASPALTNDAPAALPIGTTRITFTARDASGNAQICTSSVRVADTVPPQITVTLNVAMLCPPNHQLVPVTAVVQATDRCDPALTFRLVSIASNEPDDGLGDGDTAGDIQGADLGTADGSFLLRAERAGNGAGRAYTVVYRATDSTGNSSTASATVSVPHHR
jgi:hypothetical protein